jgi:hypothetical protein
MYQDYKDKADFLFVYIREAHPSDGPPARSGRTPTPAPGGGGHGAVAQPTDEAARHEVATKCIANLELSLPTLVDSMDDKTSMSYAGWPDRFFVIDDAGKVAYAGERGPWGFKPEEVEAALKGLLDA